MTAERIVLAALVFAALGMTAASARQRTALRSTMPFVDVSDESGVRFTHVNGAQGQLLLPEVIGAGGALFDFDNDGDFDLLLVQGGIADGVAGMETTRLFRNDTPGPGRPLRFVDVTERSGAGVRGIGMGLATGDIDNDGYVDLYITALGPNHLLRNNRNGTFSDITARSHSDDPRWGTSATFFDYDNDGRLDLFVTNYVRFAPDMKRACYSAASARDYCNPAVYDPVTSSLFHNEGNGVFSDVSARAGITGAAARGLGVIAADVDGDGWVDIYVANDGDPNQLWINKRGSARFEDEALIRGVALDRMGRTQGSMGIDLADVDGDGDEDLFITNLDNEGNTFYRNQGRGIFEDRTSEAGLFRLGLTGFGARFIDYDNDGWLDLALVNGAVRQLTSQIRAGDAIPLRQPSLLFHNERGTRFSDATAAGGDVFAALQVGRGLLAGDLDNDGDIDLVITNNGGRARVLRNDAGNGHWLGIRAIDHGRDALQARVLLARGSGGPVLRRVHTDGSYCSAGDPRVVFGLGEDRSPQRVRVEWPGGQSEEFAGLAADRYWVLERGKPPRAM